MITLDLKMLMSRLKGFPFLKLLPRNL
uniref:Uncharacterized protein n=1 Tax=Rhizophora mucronata TaxID=61149 RepID=A0A2P2NC37_RHIMU